MKKWLAILGVVALVAAAVVVVIVVMNNKDCAANYLKFKGMKAGDTAWYAVANVKVKDDTATVSLGVDQEKVGVNFSDMFKKYNIDTAATGFKIEYNDGTDWNDLTIQRDDTVSSDPLTFYIYEDTATWGANGAAYIIVNANTDNTDRTVKFKVTDKNNKVYNATVVVKPYTTTA